MELTTAALLFIAYAPLLSLNQPGKNNEWEFLLGWDDRGNFATNRLFSQSLSVAEWTEHVFMTARINVYEPVAWVFKWIVFQADARTLRAVTVRRSSFVLHFVNVVILLPDCIFRILHSMQKKRDATCAKRGATFASALFAVHPVNVEVIGWPSAQSYVLAGTFALLSTRCFLEYLTNNKGRFVLASVCFYILSAFSKAAFILLPIAFAAASLSMQLQSLRLRLSTKDVDYGDFYVMWKKLKCLVPSRIVTGYALAYMSTCCLILVVVVVSNLDGMDTQADTIELTPSQRILKLPVTLMRMLGQLLYPCNLRPHYCLSVEDLEPWSPKTMYSICGLAVVTLVSMRTSTNCFLTWSAFIALSLPTLGILQHGLISESADRYCYLPFLALTPAIAAVLSKQPSSPLAASRSAKLVSIVLVLLCFTSISHQQIEIWKNEEQMLLYSTSVDPADWRMIDIYAEFLYKSGRVDEASRYIVLSRLHSPPPEQGIKAYLHHAKLHVMQSDLSTACTMYETLYEKLSQEDHINGMAICKLRPSILLHRDEALKLMVLALKQQGLPKRRVVVIEKNIQELEKHSGKGRYYGTLMW